VIAITKRWNTISLSPGIVTFNPTGREHSFDGAFPQLFGWLLQSGQAFGGERRRDLSRLAFALAS
jgi:hypothetical protein